MKTSRLFLFLCAMPLASQAATAVYTSQVDFLNAVQNPYWESFDSFPPGSLASPQSFHSGAYHYSVSAVDDFFIVGSPADAWFSTNTAASALLFTFSGNNIFAVGGFFFTSDIGGNAAPGDIRLELNGGGTFEFLNATTPGSFLGFVSDAPITSLAVLASQNDGAIWPTVNDFIVAEAISAIPEPASSLTLAGLLACGAWMRRRTPSGL